MIEYLVDYGFIAMSHKLPVFQRHIQAWDEHRAAMELLTWEIIGE